MAARCPARPAFRSCRPTALGALLVAGLLAAASPARATVDPPSIDPGAEVAYKGRQSLDSSAEVRGTGEHALEFAYAPNGRFKTTLGWVAVRETGGEFESAALGAETAFELLEPGRHWIDVGLAVAYLHALERQPADVAIVTLRLEKRLGPTTATLNLLRTRELASQPRSANEYRFRWSLPLGEKVDVGVEAYGQLRVWGLDGEPAERTHEIGPSIYGAFGGQDGEAVAYEAALLFGVGGGGADRTLLFQLTYGF